MRPMKVYQITPALLQYNQAMLGTYLGKTELHFCVVSLITSKQISPNNARLYLSNATR